MKDKAERNNFNAITLLVKFLYLLGFFLICMFILIVSVTINDNSINEFGNIGDSISGITAPVIGLMAVIVTFLAFWVQFEANQELRNDIKLDRFETKFYELLRLHQHNVSDIDIASKFIGRKAFVKMYHELRFIYAFVEEQRQKWNLAETPKIKNNKKAFMEVAYTIFFFGLREVANGKLFYQHSLHTPLFIKIQKELKILKKNSKTTKGNEIVYDLKAYSQSLGKVTWKPSYTPFQGHVSKLGHYYRHLYQLIKFISTNQSLNLKFKKKYAYIKIVRAQLSNHEQALIYFNSFFNAGNIWWRETNENFKNEKNEVISYFLDYRIIKNLPFNLTRFGPDPVKEFSDFLEQRGRDDREINKELKEAFEWIGG